jgi:uncharacterized membrane protein YfhO
LLIVNQNWNEHWRSTKGTIVKSGGKNPADTDGGQLAIDLPRGNHKIDAYYRPRSFLIGVVVTLASMGLFVVLFARRRRSAAAA